MMQRRCGHLLAQLERVLRLLELSSSVEEDYIQIARCFEATRKKCCRLEQDGRRAREQLARAEAERAALEVKLKHARNQVEVEMKKRHRAEAELEKQERKLQLIFEFLMQEPLGSAVLTGEQRSVLSALAGRRLGGALAPGRRSSAVDESCHSLLSHSDISYDRTEDDVCVSLAPQIGPVVAAKRHRPSVAPPNAASIPPTPLPAEVPGPASSLPHTALVPPRRSRQEHRLSTCAGPGEDGVGLSTRVSRLAVVQDRPLGAPAAGEDVDALGDAHLPLWWSCRDPRCPPSQGGCEAAGAPLRELTTVWGTSGDQGCCAPARESHTEDSSVGQPAPAPLPSPPRGLPPLQHQFTSKTIIRPEPCAACGSRIRFGKAACKCRWCQLLVHAKCQEQCPGPCMPRPLQRARPRQGVLADLAPPAPPRVPALVAQCVAEVERRGLTEMGLYRVPGAEQLVRQWKRRLLHTGGAPAGLGGVADVHVVCGVLKDFLRGLEEPLLTFGLRPAFLQAADLPDEAICGAALRHAVSKLPPANRDTLAFLMLHLLRVSRSPDCRMDVLNLSRVFGPTLVGYGSANPTPLAIMEDTPRQCKVVARLLSLPPDFWRCFVEVEQENLVLSPASPLAPGSKHGPCPAEQLLCPLASPEPNSSQLSPAGTCCFPSTLRSCVGTAALPPQGPAPRSVGRFFPSLV